MNTNLQGLIKTCVEIGTTTALVNLGMTSGEISQRRAKKVYGDYFVQLERSGRIRPCRIESGRAGTRYYLVSEILSLRADDYAKAELIY